MTGGIYVAVQMAIIILLAVTVPHILAVALVGGAVIYGGFYILSRWLGFFKKDTPAKPPPRPR